MNTDFEFTPKNAVVSHEAGYHVPSNLYKIGKACDAWLQKRYASEGRRPAVMQWRKSEGYRAPAPELERNKRTTKLAQAIREHTPKAPKPAKEPKLPKASKPPKPRVRNRPKKYASDAERKAAISAAIAANWANMSPEAKAARSAKAKRKPSSAVPRHKREGWKQYKREYDRKKRAEQALSPEAIAKRRAAARRQYAKRDPELLKAQNARRRAKHLAKKANLKLAA